MNNRWRAQVKCMLCVADSTMRKAIKADSSSEFHAKLRVVCMLNDKAWAIRTTKGYVGIEKRSKRR